MALSSLGLRAAPDPFVVSCEGVQREFGIECGSLEPPTVVLTNLMLAPCIRVYDGIYFRDEKFVFISPDVENDPKKLWEVTIHEIVHYILYETSTTEEVDRCEQERMVRLVSGEPWGVTEKTNYRCPQ
jgi:hypothetical protein